MNAKKLIALILAVAMMLALVACGGSSSSSAPAESKPAAEETKEEAPAEEAAPAEDAAAEDPYADPYAANDPYADPYANNDPYADPYAANDPYADPYANAAAPEVEGYVPEAGEKYTVEVTADGWIKIENADGATLGLSSTSGVTIIEDDGYAFKDLNQNGALDAYEDWRLSIEERAADLVAQMDGAEKAAILSHGGWGDFTTEPLAADDGSRTYLEAGGRGGVTRNIARGGAVHAQWTNQIQAVAESCYYGIPAMISIDPANISGIVESVALASTMDPELAAAAGAETSKEYRAAGVTALLGPQVDISAPITTRAGGTYGEDPQLTLDITTAYVNAMQSTYVNGEDQGWGAESVYCFTKHFAGAGATEGGRDDHAYGGRYAAFPGDNYEAHLITYFDGVFSLPGKTGSSGIMTEYAVIVDGNGEALGGEGDWAGAYNNYQYGMLKEFGYSGLTITDWGVFGDFGPGTTGVWSTGVWGTEDLEMHERIALCWARGGMLLGGQGNQNAVAAAWGALVDSLGEDAANECISNAACHFITVMMELGMFENPYNDSAYADSVCYSESSNAFGLDTQRASVVMIKNDGTIAQKDAPAEKPTVYVPYYSNNGFSVNSFMGKSQGAPSWKPGMDLDVLSQYFNVITDTPVETDGVITDVERATADAIAACDYVIVGMPGAFSTSYNSDIVGFFGGEPDPAPVHWLPASLQYGEYTADTAINPSISGVMLPDGTRENRTTQGVTAPADANYGALEALEYAASVAGDVPVIASVSMDRGMVWTEVEPLVDVILVSYQSMKDAVVAEIVLGQTEPSGLLCFQQPASMEAVEAQLVDVPRDMECYVDANGNTYDFTFGLNWSGVINDARVATYSAAPVTTVQNFDYPAYAANYGK